MMTQLTKSKDQGAASNNDSIKEEQVAAYNLRNLHTLKAAVRLVKSMVNHHFIKGIWDSNISITNCIVPDCTQECRKEGKYEHNWSKEDYIWKNVYTDDLFTCWRRDTSWFKPDWIFGWFSCKAGKWTSNRTKECCPPNQKMFELKVSHCLMEACKKRCMVNNKQSSLWFQLMRY